MSTSAHTIDVLGTPVCATTMSAAIQQVAEWTKQKRGTRLVTFTNVHMVVESLKNKNFRELLRSTDANFPDGMPMVWLGRRTNALAERVCGPEFLPRFCEATADMRFRHFFFGGSEGVAEEVAISLRKRIPSIQIAGIYCPPFRPISPEEDEQIVKTINDSCADIVWVCLGCPKQENWIRSHRDRLNASVLLAVGFAFEVVAGRARRAPATFRRGGLEWFYRFCQEPRRLAKRYLMYNGIFLYRLLLSSLQRTPSTRD